VVLACRARGAVDTPRITNNTSSSGLLLRLAWACRAAALWFLAFSIWVAAAALWERRWFYEIEVLVATFLLGVPGLNLVNVLYAEGFAGLRWATVSVNGATVAMACWWALLKPSMAWSVMLGYGLPGLLLSACSLVMTFSKTARLSSHDDAALRT
jgi:hypothetical protein